MKRAPVFADRLVDAASLLMVLGGVGLFAFARQALTGISNGTRVTPAGMSAVAVTDFHVAQSQMGVWLIALGVMVGIAAAVRHKLRRSM